MAKNHTTIVCVCMYCWDWCAHTSIVIRGKGRPTDGCSEGLRDWGTEGLSDTTAIRQRYEFLPPVCLLPYSLPISRENQDFLICTAIHAISNAYPLLHHFRWKERPRTYLLTAYWYSMQPTCTSIPHLTDVARGCGDIARRTVRRSNIILLHSPFSILCSLFSPPRY